MGLRNLQCPRPSPLPQLDILLQERPFTLRLCDQELHNFDGFIQTARWAGPSCYHHRAASVVMSLFACWDAATIRESKFASALMDRELRPKVDYLQSQLQCCGVKKLHQLCTGRLDQPNLLNVEGCEAKLENLLHDVLVYAMLVILGFAIIKFFGMLSVCVITCKNGSRRSGYQPLYA
ncbi:tetraspanin-3-like protein [Lates japonicus]|uniref:Tetraspanin-3-like protein n=1 Tax=Lates japonicus TaxID=270547 RepID=A0AAD3NJI3_LATJO|nr:tetraspanin-3-like protein [Lates japonicus]